MNYWMEWLLGCIAALLTFGYRQLSARLKAANAENEALKCGMRALLRNCIIRDYNRYMEKECWPIYARDAMWYMHKQYSALGGNGMIADLMKDLNSLPTEKKPG